MPGREHAHAHPDDRGEHHGRERELKRLRKPLQDVLDDRPAGDVRAPEIATHHAARVMTELHVQRLVEAELGTQARDRLRVRALAHHLHHGISGRDVEEHEDDHEHPDERRDGEQETARQEADHALTARSSRRSSAAR